MKDGTPNTPARPHTQRPWSDAEKALVRQMAREPQTKATLIKAFPGRGLNAIRAKLFLVRNELGLTIPQRGFTHTRDTEPAMLDPADPGVFVKTWQDQQRPRLERANAAYLEALRNAA